MDEVQDHGSFTQRDVAAHFGCSYPEASAMIQAYKKAQVSRSTTLYLICRTDRTAAAVWHLGVRSSDVQRKGTQFVDDTMCTIRRDLKPYMDEVGERNPRAALRAEATLHAIEAGIEMMVAILVPE